MDPQNNVLITQLATLGSSVVLMFGITLLWRRSLHAYIDTFRWQSAAIAVLFGVIGYLGASPELYGVAIVFFLLKVVVIPRYLEQLAQRVQAEREAHPYVNVPTSLILAGLLVLLAYYVTRPLVAVSALPTRAGLPLAMAAIFVGLFAILTRRKALSQIVGFLVLENGIALLAVLGTFGIPLIIELGVFLDVLMGFLVMQVLFYHIQGTFESIDVDRLNRLKH
jgi:hydrogenase-4 component E